MKILLTMNLPYTRVYGGANRSNRSLAETLAARHHSVRVVVPAIAPLSPITHRQFLEALESERIRVKSNDGVDIFEMNCVDVHAVQEPSRLCGYLTEQIREFTPDWSLVSSEDRSQAVLETALKAHPSRVIYLAHTPQMFPFGPASLFPGERRTELIGQAAAIVTISRFVSDYIRQWTGLESLTCHPPHYGSGPFSRYGRVDNDYVLMMNACAVKGISIFTSLASAMPEVEFAALPGWGTTAADRCALEAIPNVILLENSKNLDDILRRTRVVLMPSLWIEGFGMAVVDSMLRGIPVLASNYGGLVEAKLGTDYLLPVHPIESFADELDENMLPTPVVPEQDISPWQQALAGLLADRASYERQSAAAHQAASRFVSNLGVEPLEDFLTRLAAEAQTGRQPCLVGSKHRSTGSSQAETGSKSQAIANLTPEQQAFLVMRLRKNAATKKP
jgi:glycosyltransferase involved in cell wall biosynthesis